MYDDIETVVENEFDYSNMIPSAEGVAYLVKYCDTLFSQFNGIVAQNEQGYNDGREYGRHFKSEFTVTIKQKGLNNVICKSHAAFVEAMNSGKLNHLNGLDVIMDLSYKRGSTDHRNDFKVIFRPYDIVFIRKSNHSEDNMNQIENSINAILRQFPIANSIFCTK